MKVKICGVTRPEDARKAAALGADYVGAILSPGFRRSVTPARASDYFPDGGPRLVAVLVDPHPADAARTARAARASVIQLHGEEPPALLEALRQEGEWRLWKAVRVADAADVRLGVERYGAVADGLLLDGRAPGERGGGHGVPFPWAAAEEARAVLDGLVFVAAGGLTPANVGDVVRRLAPDVVDVSSGVEGPDGGKDEGLVSSFIRNARARPGS